MTRPGLLAIAGLCLASACVGDKRRAADSSATTTTSAVNGALLGDTALANTGAATATAITPAPPSGRPVPSAIPAAPNGAVTPGTLVTTAAGAVATPADTPRAPAAAPAGQTPAAQAQPQRAFFFTTISTTAECKLSVLYIGAVHPST